MANLVPTIVLQSITLGLVAVGAYWVWQRGTPLLNQATGAVGGMLPGGNAPATGDPTG